MPLHLLLLPICLQPSAVSRPSVICEFLGARAVSTTPRPRKGPLGASVTPVVDFALIKFYQEKPTTKFLTNCTVYLHQIEVSDYFLSKALFATLPQFSTSGFPFLSLHPPPQLSAHREVSVPSLAWPSSLHFRGLYSNPRPATFSLFILSFSLPRSMPRHTLRSCPILSHADAICFLVCCLS